MSNMPAYSKQHSDDNDSGEMVADVAVTRPWPQSENDRQPAPDEVWSGNGDWTAGPADGPIA